MRYEILGPLRVTDGPSVTLLGARKIEVLLAVLLVRAGEPVSSDELIKEIWGAQAPRQTLAALHVYVSQLRKFIRRPGRDASPIVTARGGYLLRLDGDELDFGLFQDLVRTGRAAQEAGRIQEACDAYEEGLDLWRGPALEDLRDGPIVNGFVCWAEQSRLECVERFIETGLRLGRHREFVSYLYGRIEELPLHETFYRGLMLSLYRSGCRADALGVYRLARDVLGEELGLEPSADLRRLHHAVLVDAPELETEGYRPGTLQSRGKPENGLTGVIREVRSFGSPACGGREGSVLSGSTKTRHSARGAADPDGSGRHGGTPAERAVG